MSAFQLETAAAVLGPILGEVVFVGGATIHLWLTEPGAPPARATEDVDVVCEVTTRTEYYRLGGRLRERGLSEASDGTVICRWRSADPELVLGYEEAIATATAITLGSGAEIRAATPAALVATKLAAWKGRGEGDLLRSLDIHDVLTLVDGRPELVSEIEAAEPKLRAYIRDELVQLQAEPYLDYAVDGAAAGYGSPGARRADLVRERLQQCFLRC
jgi:hypothetical protein